MTVTKYFTEKGHGKGAPKRENITLMCPGSFPVASPTFTRTEMVEQIYKQFGIYEEYIVGVQAGPPFKVWFTGMEYAFYSLASTSLYHYISHVFCSGGKEKAPAIESDVNWIEFQRRLLGNKRKEKTVFASIDVDILMPYRRHLHTRVCVLDPVPSTIIHCWFLLISQCHLALKTPFPRRHRYVSFSRIGFLLIFFRLHR